MKRCGVDIRLAPHLEGAVKALLCDPQTSGGLLVACDNDTVTDVVGLFHRHEFARASLIGSEIGGEPVVRVN